jgi:hypothetical protein
MTVESFQVLILPVGNCVRPWASCLNCLHVIYFIFKMGVVIVSACEFVTYEIGTLCTSGHRLGIQPTIVLYSYCRDSQACLLEDHLITLTLTWKGEEKNQITKLHLFSGSSTLVYSRITWAWSSNADSLDLSTEIQSAYSISVCTIWLWLSVESVDDPWKSIILHFQKNQFTSHDYLI